MFYSRYAVKLQNSSKQLVPVSLTVLGSSGGTHSITITRSGTCAAGGIYIAGVAYSVHNSSNATCSLSGTTYKYIGVAGPGGSGQAGIQVYYVDAKTNVTVSTSFAPNTYGHLFRINFA